MCIWSLVMPPKKNLEELVTALTDKLDALTTQMGERFDGTDEKLKQLLDENDKLKTDVKTLQDENTILKTKLHDMELHSRSTNVRVFNFTPQNDDYTFDNLTDNLYDTIFLPILRGAASKGRMKTIPTKDRLIVSAHPLPGRDGKSQPIICRLLNNSYRTVILQCQKEFGLRSSRPHADANADRLPPLRSPI